MRFDGHLIFFISDHLMLEAEARFKSVKESYVQQDTPKKNFDQEASDSS